MLTAAQATRTLAAALQAGSEAAVALLVRSGSDTEPGGRMVAIAGCGPPGDAAAGMEVTGSLGDAGLDHVAEKALRKAVADDRGPDGERFPGVVTLATEAGSFDIYVETHRPDPELVIVGAGHVAIPLARMSSQIGFRVSVLDDRPGFATRERFPEAARLLPVDFDRPFVDVPLHSRSHIVLVTRGHRYDYTCLAEALESDPPPAYIGMIGSRRRVRATYVQLIADGIPAERLARIHAPIGLDIGAETPEEIAVAVAGELVLVRRGGSGTPLSDLERIPERFFGG